MEPTETELAEAYQENAAHAAGTNTEWSGVSTEANEQLGNHPDHEWGSEEGISSVLISVVQTMTTPEVERFIKPARQLLFRTISETSTQ